MSALTETLERILKELQKNRPAVASTLQPGLTYKEIQETTTNLPFCLPSEVYKLYQWRNGNELYEFFLLSLLPAITKSSGNLSGNNCNKR